MKIPNAYFTHISHQLGTHEEINNELPLNRQLAWDGLNLKKKLESKKRFQLISEFKILKYFYKFFKLFPFFYLFFLSLICLIRLFEYFTRNITMWKHFLKDYFIFTRKERTGIIFIVSIIIFLILISFAFPFFIKQKLYSHKQFETEIARLNIEANDSSKIKNYSKNFDNGFYDDYSPSGKKNMNT